ncbi:hypothetical protein EEL30_15840 [Brevibacillus laterosporus]|uniref:Phage portal protein n=1 Tax=Brevibacillus laterosporus TaxID=1465 RepID=A0A518V9K2_BRELA|nr:hypothetical protein EEL30_15840 [Brevibacillus laterosporus]
MSTTQEDVLRSLLDTPESYEVPHYIPRFKVNFTLKALDEKTIEHLRERAIWKDKFDNSKFRRLMIEAGCVVPNWKDPVLLEKYQTMDATDVIQKRLFAGEIESMAEKIASISGFGQTEPELVEDIKN